ncbi:MAG: mannitol dehydrogenase family protein [Beijerinckiaceae bacterium]
MTSSATDHPRLSMRTLAQASRGTKRFRYDRSRLVPGIVHLGLGAFARAHLCAYTEDSLEQDFAAWGITGVSLRNPDQRDRLEPQNGLYTLLNRAPQGETARIVGCVLDVMVGAENPEAVVARLAAPDTKIVSLTITEKGYCHDPASGRLQESHPDIGHDLDHPGRPRSAIAVIVAALSRRRAAGLAPFTVLCCDNLPHNGALVRGLVADFAALRDDTLAAWITRNGAFPGTMVDRIVPASTEADTALAARLTGLLDTAPVAHEPFSQWVIEDHFVDNIRPAWQNVGAELVSDVASHEAMKLRLLNGSHSALAYLGYLGGHETIGDCVGDPVYRRFVQALWSDEIIPVTSAPEGVDLAAYADALLTRYDNPAIRHRTWQIAMDGSQKLPQRLLATIRERLVHGLPIPRLALVIAAWMTYVGGVDGAGRPIDVRDPLAGTFRSRLTTAGEESASRVAALLSLDAVFDPDLASNVTFRQAVTKAYQTIADNGARAAIDKL